MKLQRVLGLFAVLLAACWLSGTGVAAASLTYDDAVLVAVCWPSGVAKAAASLAYAGGACFSGCR